MKYTYATTECSESQMEHELSELGGKGWRVVHVFGRHMSGAIKFLMEKEVEDEAATRASYNRLRSSSR